MSLRWHRIVTASERLWGESLWGFRWLGVKTAWCPERRKHCRRSRQTMLAWLRPRAAAIRRLTLENHHCEVLGLALPKLQSLDLVCTNSELRSEELLAALAAHTGVTWLALDCREDQRDAARELDLAALQPALQHLSRLRFFRWWYDADDTVSSIAGLAACPQLSSLHLRCCDYSEAVRRHRTHLLCLLAAAGLQSGHRRATPPSPSSCCPACPQDLRCCLRLEVLVLEDELAEGAHSASEPGDLPALQELTLPCVPHGLPAGLCLPSITRLDLGQMDEPSAVVLPPAFSQLVSLRELDTSWRRCRQAWQVRTRGLHDAGMRWQAFSNTRPRRPACSHEHPHSAGDHECGYVP